MAKTCADELRINLIGPVKVTDASGNDLTPVGGKNIGLLAILALSPGHSRPRRWLEDKLWSTFGPEQASANLRQALSKLRTTLGPLADVVVSDRISVGLDPARLRVDTLQPDIDIAGSRELLEGLDVKDPEFEDWLRQERAHFEARLDSARPRQATGVLIQCAAVAHGKPAYGLIGEVLSNQVAEGIAEQVRAWRQSGLAPIEAEAPSSDLSISCDLVDVDDACTVFLKIAHVPTGRILYTKLHRLETPESVLTAETEVAAIVFEAVDRSLGKIPMTLEALRPEARATALARLAQFRIFSFEADAMREADSLLRQAHDVDPLGIYQAWRSLIRTIQLIELLEPDPEALIEETDELVHKAMEQARDNPLVQAIASHIRVMAFADKDGAMDLAQQAIARNPFSAYSWMSLSAATMLSGRPAEAIAHSQKAREIARFSPFRQWWDLYHCIACVAANEPARAIEAGEAAARAAPYFRPAHRHLLALYAMDGQVDKALGAARKLEKIEPGFTLDRFVNDESYPVRTLRTKGLLEPVRGML